MTWYVHKIQMVLKYNFKKSLLFKLTMEAAERDLLTLLEKHTQKGKCPLAGNSVGQVQFNQGCIFGDAILNFQIL